MTQKEKAELVLLNTPESLSLEKIEKLFIYKGCQVIFGKGSHKKLIHKGKAINYVYPVHHNETKDIYKKILSKIYKTYFI